MPSARLRARVSYRQPLSLPGYVSGVKRRNIVQSQAHAASIGEGRTPDEPSFEEFKPFPRIRERDSYRCLGISKDASFEEVQDARNYLCEQYSWHEPSKEAIELAFDDIIQEKLRSRHKHGFRPPKTGRKTDMRADTRVSLAQRVSGLFDPTVTTRTIVNEAVVFGALAIWVFFCADQSFPLAATFAYSVYQFQSKRIKRNPEGPFFGGNAIVGAIGTTVASLAVGCLAMSVLTAPLVSIVGNIGQQIGGSAVICTMALFCIFLK